MKRGLFSFLLVFSSILSFSATASATLLDWPVELDQAPYQFGAGTGQHVKTLSRYFHTGQDILAEAGDEVTTPVSGRVEAGYYDYKDFDDGHSQKFFYSIKNPENYPKHIKSLRTFFEVAVIDDSGRRYEFHHIDFETLPKHILDAAINGLSIKAGTLVGHVVSRGHIQFGVLYDHIHYNISEADGDYINPFSVSKVVRDDEKPKIGNVFVKARGEKSFCGLREGELLTSVRRDGVVMNPEYIVFEGADKISDNKIPQSLTKIKVTYILKDTLKKENEVLVYDFSNQLSTDVDIRELYYTKFCIGDPSYPVSLDGSVNDKFYYKVPVAENFQGKLFIEVFDYAGNTETKTIKVENLNF